MVHKILLDFKYKRQMLAFETKENMVVKNVALLMVVFFTIKHCLKDGQA